GDGCGLLFKKPDQFFRTIVREQFSVELEEGYAVGMLFLSQQTARAEKAKTVFEQCVEKQGLTCVGWRDVPVDSSVCGDIALASLPQMVQVFIQPGGKTAQQLDAALYVARRQAEIALGDDPDFYIPTLSSQVVAYKGLVMPVDLPKFYLDL